MQPVNISCQMSTFMLEVLPTDNEWNVYPSELEKGKTHGKMFAVKYTGIAFKIVKECVDSGDRPEVSCDFWLKPKVEGKEDSKKLCKPSRKMASFRRVVFVSFQCDFMGGSCLTIEQRSIVIRKVERACTKHVQNALRNDMRSAFLQSPPSRPEKTYISFR